MWGGIVLFSNGMLQFMGLQSQNDWETELNLWLVILSIFSYTFSFQFSSVTQSRLTLCDPMDCSMSPIPVYHQLPKLAQIHVHWVGDAIQKSHPMPSPSSPAFNLSQHQGLFQWVGSLHRVAKVLRLQLSIRLSNEYSGLASFRIDWLDLLAVQRTLKSLLQHHI